MARPLQHQTSHRCYALRRFISKISLLWRLNLDDVNHIVVRIDMDYKGHVLILHALQRLWIVHGITLVVLVVGHTFAIVADLPGHVLVAVRTCLALITLVGLVSTLACALVLRPSHSRE